MSKRKAGEGGGKGGRGREEMREEDRGRRGRRKREGRGKEEEGGEEGGRKERRKAGRQGGGEGRRGGEHLQIWTSMYAAFRLKDKMLASVCYGSIYTISIDYCIAYSAIVYYSF